MAIKRKIIWIFLSASSVFSLISINAGTKQRVLIDQVNHFLKKVEQRKVEILQDSAKDLAVSDHFIQVSHFLIFLCLPSIILLRIANKSKSCLYRVKGEAFARMMANRSAISRAHVFEFQEASEEEAFDFSKIVLEK